MNQLSVKWQDSANLFIARGVFEKLIFQEFSFVEHYICARLAG
tara:strand:- start:36 stop:164 length:129 start_codon:yes stop_codon:yes gene_type:complete